MLSLLFPFFSHKVSTLGKTVSGMQLVEGSTKTVREKVGKREGGGGGGRAFPEMYASLHSSPMFFSCHFSHCSLPNRTPREVYFRMVITFVVLLLSALFATSQLKNNKNYLFISQVWSNLVSRYCAWVFTKAHPCFTMANSHTLTMYMYYSTRCEIF